MELYRLYGDISDGHKKKFQLIHGALGNDNRGETLEKLIDHLYPVITKQLASKKGIRS